MFRLGLSTAVSLVLISAAFSQRVSRKSLPTEPLEKYDNSPAVAAPILGISPALVSPFGPYTSYQVNVDANGNNRVGDAANEPSICVDRNDPNRMSIGWRQFNSVASNFREAGFAYTTNGGARWIAAGVLENNVFRSDPVLNSDAAGRFFYLSLVQNFFDDLWQSVTGGQSWTRVGPADGGDKQWFTIDNTNSSGRGFQYQCWSTDGNNYGGRQFTRSTDGGLTWLDPINIPNSPAWGTLDVDSDGNVFIGGVNLNTGEIWCVRSTNAKNGAVVPTFDRIAAVNLGGDIVFSEPINPEGLVGQVFLAVDRSGTNTNNNIYMLASVQPSGFTTGSDVMFVRSTDGGSTFNAPRRINDNPVNHAKWHWFGTPSVAPNGRIDVVWFDTRDAVNNTDSQLFYSSSIDGGNTWALNVAISNSFSPFVGYPNQDKIGDYITVVSDNAGANVAYAATFNGEEDIYYVRIPAPTPSPTPTPAEPPVVATNPVTNVASFSATLNGTVNPNGLTTAVHFDYGITTNYGFSTATQNYQGSTTQNVTANVSALTAGATYHFRIVASNPAGTTYGADRSFTTPAARAVVADFNGDSSPDFVIQNTTTHETVVAYLSNTVVIDAGFGPTLPAGWRLAGAADFNGDRNTDYALFNPATGQTVIAYLSGLTVINAAYGPTVPLGWELVTAKDFNGDAYPDYVLYNASMGQTVIVYLNNTVVVGAAVGPTLPHGWNLIDVADFDSDGHPDFALFNSGTGQTVIGYLSGPTVIGAAFGPTIPLTWPLVATADLDGDGNPDYVLYNPATRKTAIGYLTNNIVVNAALGPILPAGWSLLVAP
jgi:FG-GAP-like repeat